MLFTPVEPALPSGFQYLSDWITSVEEQGCLPELHHMATFDSTDEGIALLDYLPDIEGNTVGCWHTASAPRSLRAPEEANSI